MPENGIDVGCVVIKLKTGSLPRVREWADHLRVNKSAALQSLENEGVTVENFFLVTLDEKDYLIGYTRAESLDRASEVVKESLLEIDAYHQTFKKDTWENRYKTELLVNLSRIDNEVDYS